MIRISSLGARNEGLIVLGLVCLAIGMVVSFYHVTELVGSPPFLMEWQTVYPLLGVGITLLVAGIAFIALAFLFPVQRTQHFIGLSMTIIGIALIISGGFASTYKEYHLLTNNIVSYYYSYPYSSMAIVLGIVGLVMLIIGVLLSLIKPRDGKQNGSAIQLLQTQ